MWILIDTKVVTTIVTCSNHFAFEKFKPLAHCIFSAYLVDDMPKPKPDPTVIFKVRDPATGLYLGKKPSCGKWASTSWSALGAVYGTRAKAAEMIEHYVLNTTDLATPLEVVEFHIAEAAATPVVLPPLDSARDFINGSRANWQGGSNRNNLWYGLSPNTISGFALRRLIEGHPPKYIVWLGGTLNPMKPLNLKGARVTCSVYGKKRTYLALDDDPSMIAVKLAHGDDIVQLWGADGTLIEGDEYAT